MNWARLKEWLLAIIVVLIVVKACDNGDSLTRDQVTDMIDDQTGRIIYNAAELEKKVEALERKIN